MLRTAVSEMAKFENDRANGRATSPPSAQLMSSIADAIAAALMPCPSVSKDFSRRRCSASSRQIAMTSGTACCISPCLIVSHRQRWRAFSYFLGNLDRLPLPGAGIAVVESIQPATYAEDISDLTGRLDVQNLALATSAALGKTANLGATLNALSQNESTLQSLVHNALMIGFASDDTHLVGSLVRRFKSDKTIKSPSCKFLPAIPRRPPSPCRRGGGVSHSAAITGC